MKTLNDHAEPTKSHAKKNTKKKSSKLSSQQKGSNSVFKDYDVLILYYCKYYKK